MRHPKRPTSSSPVPISMPTISSRSHRSLHLGRPPGLLAQLWGQKEGCHRTDSPEMRHWVRDVGPGTQQVNGCWGWKKTDSTGEKLGCDPVTIKASTNIMESSGWLCICNNASVVLAISYKCCLLPILPVTLYLENNNHNNSSDLILGQVQDISGMCI